MEAAVRSALLGQVVTVSSVSSIAELLRPLFRLLVSTVSLSHLSVTCVYAL